LKSQDKLQKEKKIVMTGIVIQELPEMMYLVDAVFKDSKNTNKEYPVSVKCSVSGKMKKMLIQLRKGDEVQLEVSLYNPSVGTIIYRNTKRRIENNL